MLLKRGLFAGALFAGALFGAQEVAQAQQPVAVSLGGGEVRSRAPDVVLMPEGLMAIMSDVLPELYAEPEVSAPAPRAAPAAVPVPAARPSPAARVADTSIQIDLLRLADQAAREVKAAQDMLRKVLDDQKEKARQERMRLALLIALADDD